MSTDTHCSHLSNRDLVSLPALLYHPDRLFDPHSTPTVYFGPLAIPGPLLPLAISLAFISFKIRRFKAHRNRQIQIEIEQLPPTPRQNNLEWPDLRHPDAPRIYTAKANLLFHGTITNGAILYFGRSFLENHTLCCAEVVALFLYADIVKPEVRKSCLAAAVGWTLFMFLDHLTGNVLIAGTCLVMVLAAPLGWQMDCHRGDVEIQQSRSGFLLMLMAANRLVFDSQVAAQQWVKDHPVEAWKFLATLFIGNGLMIYAFNRDRGARRQDTHWNLMETLATLKSWIPSALNFFILVAAFLGTFPGGIVCTAYLSSCLPWNRLMFGKCASSPSLSQFSLTAGGLLYLNTFLIVSSIQQRRNERRANGAPIAFLWANLETSTNVIGLACFFMNILYLALGLLL